METQLAPGFIVASPAMKDPFFKDAVIFLMEHNREGTFGIIINRPADIEFERILDELEIETPGADAHYSPVMDGGPVSLEMGWVIHSPDVMSKTSTIFGEGIALASDLEMIEKIAVGNGPRQYVLCLGYSGWGAGQLVEEIKAGAWLFVPFCEDLFFDVPIEKRWSAAVEKLGISPVQLSTEIGGA